LFPISILKNLGNDSLLEWVQLPTFDEFLKLFFISEGIFRNPKMYIRKWMGIN